MGLHVGLDIGIASVGWCVIDDDNKRIAGLGVRTFPKAENPKTGAALAEPRRLSRSLRRRLKRRRIRMVELRQFLVDVGIVGASELDRVFVPTPGEPTPYELRAAGLDRRLTGREWARVLTQMCKRRGYKSMRLDEQPDDDEGAVKSAIAANDALMHEKGYRTVGEMLAKDGRFAESQRNKGDYKGVVSRESLLAEVDALFAVQHSLGNPGATEELRQQYVDILSSQAAIAEGPALEAKVGKCSIDRTNPRIPSATYTFERFRVVDKLHNVRYTPGAGIPRVGLTNEQMHELTEWIFQRKTPISLHDMRKRLGLPDQARFVAVRYGREEDAVATAEKKVKLPHPKFYNQVRGALEKADPDTWSALESDHELLDRVGHVLTYYKLDESVRRELARLGLRVTAVEALSPLRFSGHGHLSKQTLSMILPYMENGMQYSDACTAAGLDHSEHAAGERSDRLPAIPAEDVRNPVVLRALTQSRKVLNAIIDEFGPIAELHVEMARDLAKSAEDRRAIEKRQDDNRKTNERLREKIVTEGGPLDPRPPTMMKYKLWIEQGGRCPYSGEYIDLPRMLSEEPGVAEIDHILPHGRSFDNGYMNKVLVTATENQRKRGKTPFEYLGGDERRWHEFEERVHSMHLPRPKQERLLRTNFDEHAAEEFRDRNLTDTQYVARYFKGFVEDNLRFAGDRKKPVFAVNGGATAYLRTGWQLQKVRAEGDLHHAMDAAVIAVADASMVQGVSRFFSIKPLRNHDGDYYDPATGEVVEAKHVPEPWEGFARELSDKLTLPMPADPELLPCLAPDGPIPILVSRMPNTTVRGEIHKETVRRRTGEDESGRVLSTKRVALEDLTPRMLDRMAGRHHDRELHALLVQRLDAAGGDAKKAFAEPVYKPTRPGKVAPRVRHIRVEEDPSSGGMSIRGGEADNGAMVRTDVFVRDGKYYLVPVYLKDTTADVLPMKAIVAFKGERAWRQIDDSYQFVFSMHLNDLVSLKKRKGEGSETVFGYFDGTNRSTGSITITAHDRSWKKDGLGVAQSVISFDKYVVDVLGCSIHKVHGERRLGFSNGHHQ